jgi:cytochrome c biogenesis protein CcmG/thiol:disulfide interchange protein DsbE
VLRRRVLFLAPVGVAVLGGGAFYEMLSGMSAGRFDPHEVGTPLAGKPPPAFSLTPQAPGPVFTNADLRSLHRPVLINFFASWCIPCVEEAPMLADLRNALPIWGIAYKDKPDDAAGFIARTGDPYQRVGADPAGTVAIDWGVTGVPESFLIGRDGLVAWHFAGPLTQDVIDRELMTRLA